MLTASGKCAETVRVSSLAARKTRKVTARRTTVAATARPRVLTLLSMSVRLVHVDELTSGESREVHDVGVEPGAGPDDDSQDVGVRTVGSEGRLQLLLLRHQERQELVDLPERGADLVLVVLGDPAELGGQDARVDQQSVDRRLAAAQLLEDQVAALHDLDQVLAALVEQLGHPGGALEKCLQL